MLGAISAECIIVAGFKDGSRLSRPFLFFPADRLAELRDAFTQRETRPEVELLECVIFNARDYASRCMEYGRPGTLSPRDFLIFLREHRRAGARQS